ncbi:NACHT domain-containing protein [Maribacter sp. BPC-D8]|uniref:NACHT domain-containing protein n=1 Tax=Maribacter sp. BPC-D8 TaxID=3053613 RepID=UPI002B4606C0|nr:NACHT domain-containing protein [Maribacter sp. BPC-D8]WRI31096.1 NACHT domain-containing protein [Maribacter sp. BPC-D8]
MSKEIVSASGERAAMGGYLPQFDEFAWFVYLNLINKKLEWIRIADPKAEKLDDIQYSTHSEIHAYQVKWTIADANISFANFTDLLPLIASSWKNLKAVNPSKKIIPHLITNKPTSSNDSLKDDNAKKIGSFEDFISEVWVKIKSNQSFDDKWNPIIAELKKTSALTESEFEEFIHYFDFQPDYKQKQFNVRNTKYSKEDEDLQQISRFIIEKVASPERSVEFNRQEIIKELGWSDRFKTIFNHELIVDRRSYQPIQSTIDLLNAKLTEHKNGYLFLQGGPGSGKSTLLNQWSKGLSQRIVRYFAFDFVNPSSNLNFHERGNATHLFFDLVFQLKEAGIYKRDILPYKDLIFLKEVFSEQLKAISQDFKKNGQPTILIIDGLDHVPREYKITANSFLQELPLPNSLPEGVYIILGSQTFELEDIQQEIQAEFQNGSRTIQIDSLKKEEVYTYIDTIDYPTRLSNSQKLKIFEKSQGHPLYLSYLIGKISEADSVEDAIESFDTIDGDIDNYYKKIWKPIQKEEDLINLLGLMTRINGSISLSFIQEWDFDRKVLKSFKEKAKVLFNETEKTLSFFHNSFKQFLLQHTALDYLTDEIDPKVNLEYHIQLANFYRNSKVEKSWKQNHHLFKAKQYDKFISEVTPDNFTSQLLNFRPAEDIKQDAKLGIEIALQTKNINILIRYLFSLAEIERRLFNIDPAAFTEELLFLNKYDLARDYLRTGNTLHCSESYAFKACRLFIEFGYKSEGATLYNLAYPEIITNTGIHIDDSHRYEEIRDSLEEWIYTSPYFETTENILLIINNIKFSEGIQENRFEEKESDLLLRLLSNLGYSLIDQNKWDDFNVVVKQIDTNSSKGKTAFFELVQYCIEQCLDLNDSRRANEYLLLLTAHFTIEKAKSIGKIYIADLIYKVTRDVDETYNWIKDVKQPSNVGKDRLGYDDSLDAFLPLIKLNKLLNICEKGVSITSAIPAADKGADEEILVEFERMLCLTAQILADGILQKPVATDITKRVIPIVRFYYKEISHRNNYWYKLTQSKGQYFDYLVSAVSKLNAKSLENIGDYLFNEFHEKPKYWSTSIQRKIIKSLLNHGFNPKKAISQLRSLEDSMLMDHDIDGRITECLSHAKVWFILGKPEEGEKWLKQAIQESIGVGYRKDYQFSTWIDWLRKINLKDPSVGSERIKWFLSHLNHIKETTEGRAYWNASEELLEVTYEHNLNDGLEQTIWQLDNDLIDFKDSITLFIKYFIIRTKNEEDFKSIVQLYNSLYLLLTESANSSLLKHILDKGYEIVKEDFLREHVPDIISSINVKAYEESRHYLLSEINSFFLSKELRIEDYYSDFTIPTKKESDSSSSSSNTLTLKPDYQNIDEKEVLERVTNFVDFKKIIQEEDQANSSFNWSKVIEKITPLLSSTQIKEITSLAKIGRRESDFYAKLSEAALKLKDKELATSLANKSIELSSESGWVKYYDGGTRINAFNALKQINPILSSNKAFEVFAYDIVSGNYPSSYIEHLEDIVPLLTENYIEEELWIEIFGYLQRLMSNSKPVEDLPTLSSISQPIIETLVDYIVYLSKNPVSIIKEQSTLLLAKYINQNNDYALTQLLNGNVDDYFSMDVIIALSELSFPNLQLLKSKIQNLSISKDYQLRENAKIILTELEEDIPIPKSIKLPSVYSLIIPEPKRIEIDKEIDPYFPDVDINDPRDLIRPFEFQIRVLSKESGISESNLIYRAHSIMKEIGQEEEWTVEYEKKLRSHLEEIYLKYSYPRPRVIAARRAIMHVTTELIDSGTIDNKQIGSVFKSHDYVVPHFNELAKPVFIQTIKERDFGGVGNDWLDRINESSRLDEPLLDYKDNFKVVAEYSQVKNLDWGSPTEDYMWQIALNNELGENEDYIFGSVFHQLSSNYYELRGGGHFVVVIRDHRFDQFDLKSKWIAINPVLARHLGWEPEPTKLFAWKNSQGELMAESIYWSNGNIHMTPRKDGEVGEGWFVIVSEDGLEQLKSIEKNLFLQKKLMRSKYEDSVLMNNQIFNVTRI